MVTLETDKSWLDVEIKETVTLLRKKLEELNDTDVDRLDSDDICDIKNIYKTFYYIHCMKKQ